jgi:dihydrofolate reductase
VGNVTLWMQVSVDGFVEGPNGEFDWPVVAGELHQYFVDELRRADTFLYGRKVYEMMASFWPTADEDPNGSEAQKEYSRIWKPMPKVAFSRSLAEAGWNTRVVGDGLVDEVARLRAVPDSWHVLFGGAETAAAFMQADLIDEYVLFLHPVALGGGKPLFGGLDHRLGLELAETRSFDPGVVQLRYRYSAGNTRL